MDAKGTYDELIESGKDFAKLLSSTQDDNDDKKDVAKPPPMSRRTSSRVRTSFMNLHTYAKMEFLAFKK